MLCLSFYVYLSVFLLYHFIGSIHQKTFVQTEGKKQRYLKKLQTFFGIGLTIAPVRTPHGKPKLHLRK